MRFEVLGPLAVWTDQGEPVRVPGRKVRALLADLLVHEGRPVSVDRLVEDLWGEAAPADPQAALHVRVSQLRRALAGAEPGGRDLVVSQPPGYALRAAPDAVDAARFATLVGQAQAAGDPPARVRLLAEALALWRGPALADFADEELARAAVARWEEQRLAALEAYAEARLDLGEHRQLVAELGEQVARHPYRERLRAAHMRALYRAGRAGEALESFQEQRRRLADELGLDPGPELAALHRAILAGDPSEDAPAPPPPRVKPTNLPAPVTALIGRDHALQRVRELLTAGRLVTVTGPGGVGKTSVAVAVAWAVVDGYPDGVWLVDLTAWDGLGDPAELVLSVLSIPDAPGSPEPAAERLEAALRGQRMLLVLDNCEHVAGPVAGLVGRLLPAAPELRVLATSREPLRLRGEARWDLPPLEVPDTDDPARLARSAAVRLFLVRAGASPGPGGARTAAERGPQSPPGVAAALVPAPETVAGVADICRRLDGIPLALELAATRVPALGVSELAAQLDVPQDRFGLLSTGPRDAPARQRTLAAVIDWSWQLLSAPERVVLRRLAVHSGGFTLAAAGAVGEGEGAAAGEVRDLVAGLVDRSLVVRVEQGGGSRFRLLESVSAYCLDRLREAGEEAAVRHRHADYHLGLAEEAEPGLRGSGQRGWLRRLDAEAANLRAALDTFRRERAATPALRLTGALAWYWFLRGRLTEARRALAEALELNGGAAGGKVSESGVPAVGDGAAVGGVPAVGGGAIDAAGRGSAAVRARAAAWHAGLAIRQGQAGPDRVAEVLRGYGEVPDPVERARAQWFLAGAIIDHGDHGATGELLERALDTFRVAGDRWGEAAVLSTRAMLGHMRGDLAALEHDARRSAELFGQLGDDWGVVQATDWLVGLADLTGDHAEASRLSRASLRTAEDLGLWSDAAGQVGWLAWIAVQTGDYSTATEYAEQARRLAAEQGERSGEVFATISLGFAARRDGKLDVAEDHLRWLLDTARHQQRGDSRPPYLSMVLVELGLLAGQRDDPATALARLREGFDVCRDQGSVGGTAWALVGAAAALVGDGRPRLAAQLLGAAGAAWQPRSAAEREELARITAAVRSAEPDFDTWFARGAALTPEQARSRLDRA